MITKEEFISKIGNREILEKILADYSDNYIEYLEEDFCQSIKNYLSND